MNFNNNRIVITEKENVLCTCIFEEDELVSFQASPKNSSLIGNIYLGRVQKIVPNINAAFVEIQKGILCYLPLEKHHHFKGGDQILVQILKDKIKTKEAVVTTNICLTGRYTVVSSENKKIGYSNQLSSSEKESIRLYLGENNIQTEYGYIIRTNARECMNQLNCIVTELIHLSNQLKSILEKSSTRTLFSCVYENSQYFLEFLNSQSFETIQRIQTDVLSAFDICKSYLSNYAPEHLSKLEFYDSDYSLWKLLRFDKFLCDATSEHVWLPCGGYLVIQPTEALTVIDVNSGKCMVKKDSETTAFKINLEAATIISKQLKLRNISGIIIIDFINMQQTTHQENLLKQLRSLVKQDKTPTNVIDITSLGLVEMTRKRVYATLKEQLKLFNLN